MGRKEHQKVTIIGSFPSIGTELIGGDYSTGVAKSSDDIYNFYAPEGHIARLKAISVTYKDISNATSGQQGISILVGKNSLIGAGYAEKKGTTRGDLKYNHGKWTNADNRKEPIDDISQAVLLQNVVITDTQPLRVVFRNFTDVGESVSKQVWAWVELERVVS